MSKMPDFRLITQLTDDEVKQIINDMFKPTKIIEISRDTTHQEVYVTFESIWGNDIVVDSVTLTMPSGDDNGIRADFSLNGEDYLLYNQFLLAKGVNRYFRDNPYLVEIVDE